VGEAIDIAGAEEERAAELEGIQSEFVLMMACGASTIAAFEIVAAKKVEEIGAAEIGDGVGLALFVDEQRKVDSSFFAEEARVVAVAEADGG
jgi:hypothetical protein